jgi:hypothetical protein
MVSIRWFDEYQSKNKNINDILKDLEQRKQEIDKEMHIFKVLEIGSVIQKLIDDGTLGKYEISAITCAYRYDYDYGNELICDFHDSNGSDSFKSYLPSPFIEMIDETFKILNGFKQSNINDNFPFNKKFIIKITDNFKEKFIELMLSEPLKKILTYNELQTDLSKNEMKHNKIKI